MHRTSSHLCMHKLFCCSKRYILDMGPSISLWIFGGMCPIRTDGTFQYGGFQSTDMAEGDSIELLTLTGYYGFQIRVGSQPKHPP